MDFSFKERYGVYDLVDIVKKLRAPEGCPWDKVQTHETLRKDFIEEVYEGVKDEILDYNLWDFAVTMNMLASDNWCLLDRWFPGITDKERNVKLVEMAVNWLLDEDAKHPDAKIWHYLNG